MALADFQQTCDLYFVVLGVLAVADAGTDMHADVADVGCGRSGRSGTCAEQGRIRALKNNIERL